MKKTNDYNDIIHLPHHRSAKHKPMSLHDRAAQFAPFAALKGYDSEIDESARLTEKRISLSEDEAFLLNERIRILLEHIHEQPEIRISYFVPDMKKAGGSYQEKTGKLRRIDEVLNILFFTDGTKTTFENIVKIEGAVFAEYTENE